MKSFNKILTVDDDRDVSLAAQLFLKRHAERVDTESAGLPSNILA